MIRSVDVTHRFGQIPRSHERGHIEADPPRSDRVRRASGFRAHMSAATLKQVGLAVERQLGAGFRAHMSAATLKQSPARTSDRYSSDSALT